MKCGTTALHDSLDAHPQIAMSRPKELNFFFGDVGREGLEAHHDDAAQWALGNWHRGLGWYARHFPRKAVLCGESSPGYTSPSHPSVAARMARLIPEARLIYMVRDPLERAVSQYLHHRADGTEPRPLDEALVDRGSQYVARSRYYKRLGPFLERFHRDQITIVSQEELVHRPSAVMRAIYAFVGVDESFGRQRPRRGSTPQRHMRLVSRPLRHRFIELLQDDADRLRALAGRDFAGWSM